MSIPLSQFITPPPPPPRHCPHLVGPCIYMPVSSFFFYFAFTFPLNGQPSAKAGKKASPISPSGPHGSLEAKGCAGPGRARTGEEHLLFPPLSLLAPAKQLSKNTLLHGYARASRCRHAEGGILPIVRTIFFFLTFFFWPHRAACRTTPTGDQTRVPCRGSLGS